LLTKTAFRSPIISHKGNKMAIGSLFTSMHLAKQSQDSGCSDDTDTGNDVIPNSFTDVLYLTNQGKIPPEIKHLLKRKMLSYCVLPVDEFGCLLHRLDLVGTVIIDAMGLGIADQQKLARVIESFEMGNIGTILLNNRVKLPVKSFALAGPSVKSFAMTSTIECVSLDELWVRISLNLAYRRKASNITVRPAAPTVRIQQNHMNKLAEKLQMTSTLVDNLTEQLRMAGLVQRDFLPTHLPNNHNLRWAVTFLPAEWVSGDIYDIARLDEQHIGFYIADAVGHAMPAALLTMFLRHAIVMRETLGNEYQIFQPGDVLKDLNRKIAAQKLSGYQFATCCYCLLNTKTLELTFARAGHPYPVLIRPGQEPKQLQLQGPLLGIFDQSEYPGQTIQLQAGDKLMLYSDGAEPFLGGFDEMTGFRFSREFSEIMKASAVEMVDAFNTFVSSKEIAPCEIDDVTVLVLEIL